MRSSLRIFLLICCVGCGLAQRVGNPDDTAKIERPCPTFDLNCIRKYFREHAHCKTTYGPAPDPIRRPISTVYIPRSNITVTLVDEYVRGINGRIEEFYINKDTDKMVFAVDFKNLNLTSDNTYFRFHRRAKEPVVTNAYASVNYVSIVITAVIPKIDDLQLERAECTAFLNDPYPPTIIGPSAANSTDPQVPLAIADLLANLPIIYMEQFLTDASYYITTYIQYNICDFGLMLVL